MERSATPESPLPPPQPGGPPPGPPAAPPTAGPPSGADAFFARPQPGGYPPAHHTTATTGASNPRTLRLLGGWTQGLLWASLGTFLILGGVMLIHALVVWSYHDGEATLSEIDGGNVVIGAVLILLVLPVFIATAVLFLIWQFRHHKQLAALRGTDALRRSPGFGVGCWFIPVVNLWFPALVISELWKTSARPGAAGPDRTSPMVWSWWSLFVFTPLAWLVTTFVWGFYLGASGQMFLVEPTGMVLMSALTYLAIAGGAGVGARMVAQLTRRIGELSSAAGW